MQKYKQEFPDFDHELPILSGWEDVSWHNNEMPCLKRDITTEIGKIKAYLWCDYNDPSKREFPDGNQYSLDIFTDDTAYIGTVASGNSLAELKQNIDAWRIENVGEAESWGEKSDGDIFADVCEMYAYHKQGLDNEPGTANPVLLDAETLSKVGEVGELLIRACAVLGTLTPHQQANLQAATDGGLPDSLVMALRSAKHVSPEVRESLLTHPPKGLGDLVI